MKQIWPNYSYSPTTNVLTLTGLNIDRDQLLLVSAPERGRIMYNFADSTTTASAFTAGANTGLTLVASTAGLTTTAALVIYYDDQLQSTAITISNFPASQAVTFGQAIVSASNITGLNNSVGTDGSTPAATNFIKIGGHQDGSNQAEHIVHVSAGGSMKVDASDSTVTFGVIRGTVTVGNSLTISSLPAISGTVTANLNLPSFAGGNGDNLTAAVQIGYFDNSSGEFRNVNSVENPLPISGTVTIDAALPAGTNRIGVVTIGAGTVTIGAGTAQIGSVTASISNFPASQPVSLTTLPSLVAGTAQIGSVTASISGTVPVSISSVTVGNSVTIGSLPAISGTVTANTFALQGTAVTTSNFTSTTASTVLANYNATREVLTIFNEGAGNLHIAPGATCTTIAYQVRLSSGDYYEVPNHQTTITHSAVFATAGTARICQLS
jgi:hypothetical protein